MRLPLWLLNSILRVAVKLPLGWIGGPLDFRQRFERDARLLFRPPPGSQFSPEQIKRADGSGIRALWASLGRPDRHKVILFLHGGAYIAGSIETHKHLAAALAGAAGARALVPDYRLAPEHTHPAALDDAEACYRFLLERGYAPENIALAGDSAGGGLAAALLLRLAARGLPQPAALAAFSPWADLTGTAGSLKRNARREAMLPVHRMPEVIDFFLGGADAADPEASPILGAFQNPPPALIMASRAEILVDDATGLAEALRAAGGDVQLELWKRTPHAWPVFTGKLRAADRAVRLSGAFLARHLGGSG